jgi:hypothetical protein
VCVCLVSTSEEYLIFHLGDIFFPLFLRRFSFCIPDASIYCLLNYIRLIFSYFCARSDKQSVLRKQHKNRNKNYEFVQREHFYRGNKYGNKIGGKSKQKCRFEQSWTITHDRFWFFWLDGGLIYGGTPIFT